MEVDVFMEAPYRIIHIKIAVFAHHKIYYFLIVLMPPTKEVHIR